MAARTRRAQRTRGTAKAGIRQARAVAKAGKLAALQAAYKEALERQTATSDVLTAISGAQTDVAPVFDAIARNAHRLCGAMFCNVLRYDGELLHIAACHGFSAAELEKVRAKYPVKGDDPSVISGRVIRSSSIEHIADVLTDPYYDRAHAASAGWRRMLGVPMLRDGVPIGVIVIAWREPGRTPQNQVDLLHTFAAQAVIAIENVRLFNETKEALERQTATANILKVMSGSPTDVQPVFDTIIRNAVQLCDGKRGTLFIYDGTMVDAAAHYNMEAEGMDLFRRGYPKPLDAESPSARAISQRRVLNVADVLESDFSEAAKERARVGGYRAVLTVPMMRAGAAVGTLAVGRPEPGPFGESHISLLKTFADQAVIAIENVRLFKELEARNRDLSESLEQQTATSEVLQAISRSTFDINAVLQVLIENATRLAGATQGFIFRFDGERARLAHSYNARPAYKALIEANPIAPGRGTLVGRTLLERRPVRIPDVLADPEFTWSEAQRLGGFRSMLAAPMLREGAVIGVIAMWSEEVRAFTDRQTALVSSFADQAVIAIENVRLFNETKEALEQQTAISEVLRVISNSPSDVQPVLEAVAQRAAKICDASDARIFLLDGDTFRHVAGFGDVPVAQPVVPLNRGSTSGRAILDCEVQHVEDILATDDFPVGRAVALRGGWRTVLSVPLLRENRALGTIALRRKEVRPFSEKQVGLLKTFADQAAIAIENVRLFREIQEKSAQLEVANKHKSEFLANMSHELRTPLNAVIGFSEVLMDKMFGEVNAKQLDYLKDIHESGKHLLSLINDILDLSKIEAGRMELEVSAFHLPSAISNAMTLVRERAQRHGIELRAEVDERLGELTGDERKFKQIMLNLLSNAVKFTPDGGRVDVSAKRDTTNVEIAVRDTGVGIAPEDQAALFEEFKQVGRDGARKAEGTGLGLALTKRFVELHGGAIRVDSAPGKGSTFTVSLPIR